MALNIKTEPCEGTSNIVDLSSDTDVPLEVPEMKPPEHPPRPGTPDTHCSICLEELNNKCHSDACWHKFCFECLKRWSLIERSCPLCKKNFRLIHHSFNNNDTSSEIYEVPSIQADEIPRLLIRPLTQMSEESRTFRMNLFLDIVRRNGNRVVGSSAHIFERNMHSRDYNFNIHAISDTERNRSQSPVGNLVSVADHLVNVNAQVMRRRVYEDNMWAQPLPDLSGRFRECSSAFFRDNPAQTYRLHGFILRDITVLRAITMYDIRVNHRTGINEEVLTNMVMRSILSCDIRDMQMITMLHPYIADYADHFIHELYNYANSPYDLIGYDRNVRYIDGRLHRHTLVAYRDLPDIPDVDLVELSPVPIAIPINSNLIFVNDPIEPIVVDTDDEDQIIVIPSPTSYAQPEVIEINSSSGESDVEILSIVENEPPDTFNRDQPSTSTGIRDSYHIPNTRYNLRRRRLFQTNLGNQPSYSRFRHPYGNYPVERINLDSSSDDETVETNTRGTQTTHMTPEVVFGRRKRKNKKSKHRKKKNVVNCQSEVRTGNRARSGSESSSSSDTDTSADNNFMNVSDIYS